MFLLKEESEASGVCVGVQRCGCQGSHYWTWKWTTTFKENENESTHEFSRIGEERTSVGAVASDVGSVATAVDGTVVRNFEPGIHLNHLARVSVLRKRNYAGCVSLLR